MLSGSKLAVLESKLGIYEDLSREMLSKLESAVDKISEGNSRIATILAKHDERIEQSMKTDELLIRMIDEIKKDNQVEHDEMAERFNKIEENIDNLLKFRWQVGGVLAVVVIVVTLAGSWLPNVLTSRSSQITIERAK
jgi:predicted  nucleic acid-binding Zn-ribbon protein